MLNRLFLVFLVLGFASISEAQESISHEYFTSDNLQEFSDQMLTRTAQEHSSEIFGRLKPSLNLENNGEELTLGSRESQTPVNSLLKSHNGNILGPKSMRLDRNTKKEKLLRYYSTFNPSLAPLKRGGVLDQVIYQKGHYHLIIKDQHLSSLQVVGDRPDDPDRDRFWGSMRGNFEPGVPIPIPSVSAGAEILSYQTTPVTSVEFLVDGAENYYVKTSHRGDLRINFLTSAPQSYFNAQMVPGETSADIPQKIRPGALPEATQKIVKEMLGVITIEQGADLKSQVEILVGYFRNFRALPLDVSKNTGDDYRDITLNQQGVCRHRAFAFIITAHYLGIPARYVFNEAHAFVEVFTPSSGWFRVNLGGASEGLDVMNSSQKPHHHSDHPDPFLRPSNFDEGGGDENTSSLGVSSSSQSLGFARDEQIDDVKSLSLGNESLSSFNHKDDSIFNLGHHPKKIPSIKALLSGNELELTQDQKTPQSLLNRSNFVEEDLGSVLLKESTKTSTLSNASKSEHLSSHRKKTYIEIFSAPTQALRGRKLKLSGHLWGEQSKIKLSGFPIFVALKKIDGDGFIVLNKDNKDRTNTDGQFSIRFEIPQTIELGRWELLATFPGDKLHLASQSD